MIVDHMTSRKYECRLYGPYEDDNNQDIRVYAQVRTLDGHTTLTLMAQDIDDDAWLNSDAKGLDPVYSRFRLNLTGMGMANPYIGPSG